MDHHCERIIGQGNLYWIQLESAEGENARIPHPYVVIEIGASKEGQSTSVLVCALTSNLKRVSLPGNLLLDEGEGNLPRRSVVEVSKVLLIEAARLGEQIGTLSLERVAQIEAGRRFVQRSVAKKL